MFWPFRPSSSPDPLSLLTPASLPSAAGRRAPRSRLKRLTHEQKTYEQKEFERREQQKLDDYKDNYELETLRLEAELKVSFSFLHLFVFFDRLVLWSLGVCRAESEIRIGMVYFF